MKKKEEERILKLKQLQTGQLEWGLNERTLLADLS